MANRVAILCLATFLSGFYSFFILPDTAITMDCNIYLEGADSLQRGAYRHDWHAGRPPITLYPPGQSALLALGLRLANPDAPFPTLTAICLGIAALAVILLYSALRAFGLPVLFSLLCAMLVGTSPSYVILPLKLFSEPLFLAFLNAALLLGFYSKRAGNNLAAFLSGLSLAAAFLCRTAAIPFIGLLLAFTVYRWYRDRRISIPLMFAALPGAIAAIAWWLFRARQYSHADMLVNAWRDGGFSAVGRNFLEYLSGRSLIDSICPLIFRFPAVLANHGFFSIAFLAKVAVIALGLGAVFIIFHGLRRSLADSNDRFLAAASLAYVAMLIVWPNYIGARSLFPILPAVFVFWFAASARNTNTKTPIALLSLMTALNLVLSARGLRAFGAESHLAEQRELHPTILELGKPTVAAGWQISKWHLHHETGARIVPELPAGKDEFLPSIGNETAELWLIDTTVPNWSPDTNGWREIKKSSQGNFRLLSRIKNSQP